MQAHTLLGNYFEILDEHDDGRPKYRDFDILEDLDTVLFLRVNSFYHSISNEQLDLSEMENLHMNESMTLAHEEYQSFVAGKINFFFHQLQEILSPEQQRELHEIHKNLNTSVADVIEYFHTQACQILSPGQLELVKTSAMDLIRNVQIELARVRGFEVPGGEPDEHAASQIRNERDVILEHARHFVERVERIITIDQWRQFESLTIQCKHAVHTDIEETNKMLSYLLSPSQMQQIIVDTHKLQQDLGSLVDEYSIAKPHFGESLGQAKNQAGFDRLEHHEQEMAPWERLGELTHEEELRGALEHEGELVNFQQKVNGIDFDEDLEEFEEAWSMDFMSEENFFLAMILFVVVTLGIILYVQKKRRSQRQVDSQVTKYKSLGATFDAQQRSSLV